MSFIIIVIWSIVDLYVWVLNLHIHFYYSKITIVHITHAFHSPYRILQSYTRAFHMVLQKNGMYISLLKP